MSSRPSARVGRRAISTGRGLLLAQCRPEVAAGWARRALGALTLATLEGWTVVVPTGPARARYPYDDAVRSLAGRPVGAWMRPALGFFHDGRQAVVTVHPSGWRAVQRWVIWTPREGSVAPVGLPPARPHDLVVASGVLGDPEAAERDVRDLLSDGRHEAIGVLTGVMDRLGLPGADLVRGELRVADLPGAREVVPAPRHARSFDRLVADDERHRLESES